MNPSLPRPTGNGRHAQRAAVLVALVLLAGCAVLRGPRPPAPTPAPSVNWLVGSWVMKGDSCSGDLGIVYRKDGTWRSQDVAGTWRMNGDIMQIEVRGTKGAAPLHYSDRIEKLGPNEYVAQRPDVPIRHLFRCRSRRK